MRIAWLGLAAAVAVPAVSSCGTLGLIGAAALMVWPGGKVFPPKPSRFRVGGTIHGLSGSVTLQLNEAEILTRSKDGPFSFESPIENRSEFSVRVTESPSEQSCALWSASGVVNGEDVDSVEVNCALRTYPIGGTVTGLIGQLDLRINDHETLSITSDGLFLFQTSLSKGQTYEVTVAKHPQGQLCSVSEGGSGAVQGNVDTIAVRCNASLTLDTSHAADRVIGQSRFDAMPGASDDTVGPTKLKFPWGNAVFAGGRLYVPDRGAHRILVFSGLPENNGDSADFVLGQPDFQSMGSHSGRDGFSSPESLSSDGDRLAVADKGNHRVLLYKPLPAEGSSPTMVLGQSDFDTPSSAECNANSLSNPEGVFIGHGKLLVADTSHNRVLIWELDSLENGKAASLVLGQTSFERCTANDSDRDGRVDTRSASTLNLPEGVWTDGKRLIVADSGNNRVLIWEEFPTKHGEDADVVLGASSFTSDSSGMVTRDQLLNPRAVTSTSEQVFVADHGNNRVLVWNQFPHVSGAPADRVLGQINFTSRAQLSPPTNQSLYEPSGVLVAVPYLIVTDSRNKRLLMFKSP